MRLCRSILKATQVATLFLLAAGCVTPAPIKEATVALDDGYKNNLKMMRQYDTLVRQINERHELLWKSTKRRSLLKLAVEAATIDTSSDDDELDRLVADEILEQLGPELVSRINDVRLRGLPERKGSGGIVILRAADNTHDLNGVLSAIPQIVAEIERRLESDYSSLVENDRTGFSDYKTNVWALRRINATIQRYLEIDITMAPDDVDLLASITRQRN